MLGIHFGRHIGKDSPSDDRRKREGLTWGCLYHALPGKHATSRQSILPEKDEGTNGGFSIDTSSSKSHSDGSEETEEWDHEVIKI